MPDGDEEFASGSEDLEEINLLEDHAEKVAAEHGTLEEVEVEDEPLDEDEVLVDRHGTG